MDLIIKKQIISLLLMATALCLSSSASFALSNNAESNRNYIVNSTQIPTLLVEYRICSYDYTNPKIKAWICRQPGNSVAVQQKNDFTAVLPDNQVDGSGVVQVAYDIQIISVTNSANMQKLRQDEMRPLCTTEKGNTLVITGNTSGIGGDLVKCTTQTR